MSTNGNKLELPASIIVRDLAQKIEKSPIDLIKKLMTNGVMATINQTVDFDTAAIVVAEYGFEAVAEVVEVQRRDLRLLDERRDIPAVPVTSRFGHHELRAKHHGPEEFPNGHIKAIWRLLQNDIV